ncbi:MAG: BlaI/MecI/CopY family transcriptional regulator [Pseudomonadota bacterium]
MSPNSTELRILKLLWRDGARSAGEIHAAIGEALNWSRSSTRKTIERMVAKDMVSIHTVHGLQIYKARLAKVPTLAGLIQNFARTVLSLEGPLPVSNLVKSEILSADELAELEAFLAAENAESDEEDAS